MIQTTVIALVKLERFLSTDASFCVYACFYVSTAAVFALVECIRTRKELLNTGVRYLRPEEVISLLDDYPNLRLTSRHSRAPASSPLIWRCGCLWHLIHRLRYRCSIALLRIRYRYSCGPQSVCYVLVQYSRSTPPRGISMQSCCCSCNIHNTDDGLRRRRRAASMSTVDHSYI